jgi:hypothetical protein
MNWPRGFHGCRVNMVRKGWDRMVNKGFRWLDGLRLRYDLVKGSGM